uniref:ENDO-BETA-1,4-XYLANASE n=1 Tax=Cellvibrio japonicus TaxID=155077 RepID=UPI0000232404|nr:Chain A, ENDO-BETA-1,4-XYLANASE [Cellvibrio japonicus]
MVAASEGNVVIEVDMANGWRGNASGSTSHSGITYSADGVTFAALGDGVGAVFDIARPTTLEDAVIAMVVNVSAEFKASEANLQIFAQLKEDWSKGEWDCLAASSELTADTDLTLTCTIDEDDDKFNQTARDVQVGIQAKGTPAGTITIKSVTITLAQEAYSANVDHLRDLAPSDFPIGVAVSNTDSATYNLLTNSREQAVVKKHFNHLTAGNIMKMSYMQPTEGNFNFTNADAFVDWATENNMTVHGHALVWHSDYQVPNFMKNWAGSAEDFLAALDTHITTIVDHYEAKGNLVSWDVVNAAIDDNSPANFRTTDSAFYVKSGNSSVYIERAFQTARAADPAVILYYNDYNIEQNNAKTTKMVDMVKDFQARSIPIDGVGFQMHVCMNYPSIANISAAMKKVVDLGLLVKITELDVAVNQPHCDAYPANKINPLTEAAQLAQKKRYCDVVKAYLDTVPVNQRGGISVWGTTDANTWLDGLYREQFEDEKISWPLLFDNNYNDKPALRGFADALIGTQCTNTHELHHHHHH